MFGKPAGGLKQKNVNGNNKEQILIDDDRNLRIFSMLRFLGENVLLYNSANAFLILLVE